MVWGHSGLWGSKVLFGGVQETVPGDVFLLGPTGVWGLAWPSNLFIVHKMHCFLRKEKALGALQGHWLPKQQQSPTGNVFVLVWGPTTPKGLFREQAKPHKPDKSYSPQSLFLLKASIPKPDNQSVVTNSFPTLSHPPPNQS